MRILVIFAGIIILILLIFLFVCEKKKNNLSLENDIFSKRLSQLSVDSAAKIQIFTRLSTILSSSFDRNLLLPQIITDLASFFPASEIRIILKNEHGCAVRAGGENHTVETSVPFSELTAALNSSKMAGVPSCMSLLDERAQLPYMYQFPLYVDEQITGYMVVSGTEQIETKDYHFFSDIAVILSSILQNILTVREKDFINEQFGRSVDPTVRDYLLTTKEEGRILPLSVLFFDIRNFTGLSEKIGPTQSVALLNDIFSRCDGIIRKEGGFINKFTGDGFMAVFGAPEISKNHEQQAVRSALSILEAVDLPCGIGIASGDAVAGTIGSAKRKEYTVIGDTVNTASRIESLCKLFGSSLLISDNTMEQVKDEIPRFRFLGQIRLKGKKEPVGIFDLSSKGACYDDSFLTAVFCYYRSDFSSAIEQFTMLQKMYPEDKAIAWFISRCTARKKSTVPWDGIELMTEK